MSVGVGILQVRSILGETSSGLKDLCISSRINAKSFRKPVRFAKPLSLTDTDKRQCNWGWSNFQGNAGNALYQVLNAKGSGQKWSYIKPDVFFRLMDFDGYKHNATEPMAASLGQQSYRPDSNARLSFADFDEMLNHLYQWGDFDCDPLYMGIGVAFAGSASKTNWTASDTWYLLCGYNLANTWQEMDNETIPYIPATVLSELGSGDWYCYPFIVKDTRDIQGQKVTGMGRTDCYMLYSDPISFTILHIDPYSAITINLSGSCDGDAREETYSNIQISVDVITGADIEAISSMNIEVVMEHCGTLPNQDNTVILGTASLANLQPNRTYTLSVDYPGTIYPLSYDPSGDGRVPVKANASSVVSGQTYAKTVTGQIDLIEETNVTVTFTNITAATVTVSTTGDISTTFQLANGASREMILPAGSSIGYTAQALGYISQSGNLSNITEDRSISIDLSSETVLVNVPVNVRFMDGQMFHDAVEFRWRYDYESVSRTQYMVAGNNTLQDMVVGNTMIWEAWYQGQLKASGTYDVRSGLVAGIIVTIR